MQNYAIGAAIRQRPIIWNRALAFCQPPEKGTTFALDYYEIAATLAHFNMRMNRKMNHMEGNVVHRLLITQKEAEKRWRTSRQTLWHMRRKGLPFYRLNTKILYDVAEVEAFIRRGPRVIN